jgi:hypothetical protein
MELMKNITLWHSLELQIFIIIIIIIIIIIGGVGLSP